MKNYLLFLAFLHSYVMAQTSQIVGKVNDLNGIGVPFVSLNLNEFNKGIYSDEFGGFAFRNLKNGEYTLVASFVGYKTLEQKVKLEEGKTLVLNLALIENTELLKEIVIQGYLSQNERVVSVGKMPIRAMDLPQSIMTLDRKILKDQQVNSMSDILANTNGVYIMGATGGYQEEIAGRGFSYGSNNTFKNGVRYFGGMMTETSSLEKVEIMKGSSAILFGNVSAGGVLNLVTKKPKFDFGGEVSLRVGSFGQIKPTFDVYSGIGKNKNVAFRLNGTYEKAESFRKGVSSERFYINPSLFFKLGKKTTLLLEADAIKDERTPDFGAGIVNYEIINIPRERFLGVSWSKYRATQSSFNANINHSFSKNWSISGLMAYRSYSTSLFANSRPNSGGLIKADGNWVRNIQKTEVKDDYKMAQLDLKGEFALGNIRHQLLIGADVENFKTLTFRYNPLNAYDTINIYDPNLFSAAQYIPELSLLSSTTAPVNRAGVYAQDLVHFSSKIKFLLGLRYSYQDTRSEVLTETTQKISNSSKFDGAFSPRLGLVYQLTKDHSFFASYANSFELNTGVDTSGKALPPSIVNQYEIGVKNEFFEGKVSANVTAYKILNDNLAQTSLANGNTNSSIKELAGTVESQGLEIDLNAMPIKGLNILAGYSYNITKYTKSNTYIVGSLLRYNPNHTANFSFNYRFQEGVLKRMAIGVTNQYIGKRFAGRSTRLTVENDVFKLIKLPAFTQSDVNLSYSFKQFTIKGKIGNVFDKISYNVHDDNSVNPIMPRNFSMILNYAF